MVNLADISWICAGERTVSQAAPRESTMNLDLVVFASIGVLLFNYTTIRTVRLGPALDRVERSDKKRQTARVSITDRARLALARRSEVVNSCAPRQDRAVGGPAPVRYG